MTVWDKIYQDYKNGGEEYATLKKGLIPEFLEFINNHTFKLKKVLDIGCGNGKYLAFLKTLGFKVSGIDSSPTAVEMTKESLEEDSTILCASMYEYIAPSLSYDLIISIAAIGLGISTQAKYWKNCKQGQRLPGYPPGYYHDFPGWLPFLGKLK